MKKLIGILLALVLATTAFGQLRLINMFQSSDLEAIIIYTINR